MNKYRYNREHKRFFAVLGKQIRFGDIIEAEPDSDADKLFRECRDFVRVVDEMPDAKPAPKRGSKKKKEEPIIEEEGDSNGESLESERDNPED